ncbi:MAG: DUF4352 domain-containing protein [Mycobacterium sp.]
MSEQVRASMQSKFDSDADFENLRLRVDEVTVVKGSGGNDYQGLASVRAGNGDIHDVAVEITVDGENLIWQTSPGAFLFAAQEMLSPTPTPSSAPVASPPVPIGTPTRDGQFEFTVTKAGTASTIDGPYGMTFTPRGQYMIVALTVRNVSDQQGTYSAIEQKLIIDGKQYTYSGEETFALSPDATAQINPGLAIDTMIVYDVPLGGRSAGIELHGGVYGSPGVYSKLA